MKLIDNWRRAHRFISLQLIALDGIIQAVWPNVPPDLKAALPAGLVSWISLTLLACAIGGRLIDQGQVTRDAPPQP